MSGGQRIDDPGARQGDRRSVAGELARGEPNHAGARCHDAGLVAGDCRARDVGDRRYARTAPHGNPGDRVVGNRRAVDGDARIRRGGRRADPTHAYLVSAAVAVDYCHTLHVAEREARANVFIRACAPDLDARCRATGVRGDRAYAGLVLAQHRVADRDVRVRRWMDRNTSGQKAADLAILDVDDARARDVDSGADSAGSADRQSAQRDDVGIGGLHAHAAAGSDRDARMHAGRNGDRHRLHDRDGAISRRVEGN